MIGHALRLLLLWCFRAVGRLSDLLRREAVLSIVIAADIAGILALADLWSGAKPAERLMTATHVAAVWAVIFVTRAVVRARHRMVVGRFEDFSDKKAGIEAAGFGVLVTAQMSWLNMLFRQAGTGEGLRPLFAASNVAPDAADAGLDLDRAVSSEASLALGPLKIPIGFVMGLLGRLVQGPRLSGQIQYDAGRRIITAKLSATPGERTWRMVDEAIGGEPGQEQWRPAADLAEELAFRVWAELGEGIRWQALSKLANGLQAYRRSMRHERDRPLNLRKAERHLIDAVGEDSQFDLASYNLGIVYGDMNQLEAAVSAFERSLRQNPRRWSTHCALAATNLTLAITAFQSPDGRRETAILNLSKALDFSRQAIHLAPDAAAKSKALEIMASTYWWRAWNGWSEDQTEARVTDFYLTGRAIRDAVRQAWRALYAAELGVDFDLTRLPAIRAEKRAALAQALRERAAIGLRAGSKLLNDAQGCLRLAHDLMPGEAQACFELGTAYGRAGKWEAASRMYRNAARLASSADTWALLALALSHRDKHHQAADAMQRAFERAHELTPQGIAALIEVAANHRKLIDEIAALGLRGFAGLPRYVIKYMGLAYRIAERRMIAMGEGSKTLTRLMDLHEREKESEKIGRVAERAAAFDEFSKKVAELRAKKEEGVADLIALQQQQREAQRPWEAAEAGQELALVYINAELFDEAERCLRDLIAYLQKSLHGEIKRRGLYSLLARALRSQKVPKFQEALAEARKAVELDPLSAYEQMELGRIHFELAEYRGAQRAWEEALLLKPDSAELHVRLGMVHYRRFPEAESRTGRMQVLETARTYLETALELYDRGAQARNVARYILARVYQSMARYVDALRELRILEKNDFCPTAMRLQIADTYLSSEEWVDSEFCFRDLIKELEARMVTEDINAPLPSPVMEDAVPLGIAATFAHLGVACCLAARNIALAEALDEVTRARASLTALKDRQLAAQWSAKCDFFEGQIFLKQDQVDPALARLEAALIAEVTADAYLTMAEALARRAECLGKGVQQAPIVRRALWCCSEADRLDWKRQLAKRVPATVARLEALGTA